MRGWWSCCASAPAAIVDTRRGRGLPSVGTRPSVPIITKREARRHLRLPVRITGRDAAGAPFQEDAQTVNISGGGLCFESARSLPVGGRLALRIAVPPALRRHFGG